MLRLQVWLSDTRSFTLPHLLSAITSPIHSYYVTDSVALLYRHKGSPSQQRVHPPKDFNEEVLSHWFVLSRLVLCALCIAKGPWVAVPFSASWSFVVFFLHWRGTLLKGLRFPFEGRGEVESFSLVSSLSLSLLFFLCFLFKTFPWIYIFWHDEAKDDFDF